MMYPLTLDDTIQVQKLHELADYYAKVMKGYSG